MKTVYTHLRATETRNVHLTADRVFYKNKTISKKKTQINPDKQHGRHQKLFLTRTCSLLSNTVMAWIDYTTNHHQRREKQQIIIKKEKRTVFISETGAKTFSILN